MKRTILLLACAGILGSQMAMAAEGEIPKFDIAAACRGSGSVQTPAQCINDEQAARDLLARQWPQFKQTECFPLRSDNDKPGGRRQLHRVAHMPAGSKDRRKEADRSIRAAPANRQVAKSVAAHRQENGLVRSVARIV